MSTKSEKDRAKQIQDKCQSVLNELLRDEDNKYCVDCDTKGPRWASWNLGVFLCIRCAGIHRNLGVHISKVKSVNLDSWTPEQVASLQQMGNSRARAVYEANLPDNFRRPQSDSSLESFVRAKYEHKKYIAREWVPPPLPKVNWEKEIDEEIERQKRKKNKYTESKSITIKPSAEIPQLPKPKSAQSSSNTNSVTNNNLKTSSSPKPTATTNETPSKSNVDLLSLNSAQQNSVDKQNDDAFSSFLSGPTESVKKVETDKSEEENFFNQPAPTEKEKTQLTKDSILALYGNTPKQQTNLFQTPFPTNFQQAGAAFPPTAFGGPVSQPQIQQQPQIQNAFPGYNAFNGYNQFLNQQPTQQAQFGAFGQNFAPQPAAIPQQMVAPQQNFGLMGSATSNTVPQLFPQDNSFFQPAQCFGVTQPPQPQQQFTANMNSRPTPVQNIVPNPFLTQPVSNNIQQQFGNLTLNNVVQQPAKVTTNVWQ
ncbi:stromal membrane-associated protein 1 [Chrysoperla carnea]|uniref:stromal membrane-associated protein 1 n=1 Tax=Chrysoperla carnea TaxID=189513 RepID=UPI001D065402|nr:stromal membrane-associated protein 1 [Chrysoperla carnea]